MTASGGLITRIVVGAALIVVACAAVWYGGLAFTALVTIAVLLMSAEWCVMHGIGRGFRLASLIVLAFTGGVAARQSSVDAIIVLAASAGLLGLFMRSFDRQRAFWLAAGLLYCGLPMIALIWLRGLPNTGIALTIAVLAVVWATDIGAYFTGRAIGGSKLAPAISPNKTWAGAIGGVVAAIITGAILTSLAIGPTVDGDVSHIQTIVIFSIIAAFLAVAAIVGDLFESWLKRRAGVKDSGNLLPGHGGVMDRIDGLVPVAVFAAAIVAISGITP
ncbi:phosphatidate cytidylyltransferase [Glacieibacterium megasporae]|uniref:phosphatidate cytidylyltransferase n=1 Tax=Glacieibacterium megasporae TaxID=2835787 RepID=UPI002106AC47|nr:CDP-archaeol synthase [Polymorphobacter megasporae]